MLFSAGLKCYQQEYVDRIKEHVHREEILLVTPTF